MDDELEEQLADDYPLLYSYLSTTPSEAQADTSIPGSPPITVDGIVCDDGWYWLLDAASSLLERFNERQEEEDGEIVRVVQVKEKFGELRLETTSTPSYVSTVIRLVEELSGEVCERCGETRTVRRHKASGYMKTLCESCGYDWRDAPDNVEVWKFPHQCHECGEVVSVVYPRGIGGKHGGTWEAVGEQLADLDVGNVEQVYSSVQQTDVWGNKCSFCDAYLGNYYIHKEATRRVNATGGWEESNGFEKVTVLKRDS